MIHVSIGAEFAARQPSKCPFVGHFILYENGLQIAEQLKFGYSPNDGCKIHFSSCSSKKLDLRCAVRGFTFDTFPRKTTFSKFFNSGTVAPKIHFFMYFI